MSKCKRCGGSISFFSSLKGHFSNWWENNPENGYCDECILDSVMNRDKEKSGNRILQMREAGYSYDKISRELNIPNKKAKELYENKLKSTEKSIEDFQDQVTWELPIEYEVLKKDLKKTAGEEGYGQNDDVIFQVDGRTGQFCVKPKLKRSGISVQCIKCGDPNVKLQDNYQIVHGRYIGEKELFRTKDIRQLEKKLNLREYSIPICQKCIERIRLKSLFWGIGITVVLGASFFISVFEKYKMVTIGTIIFLIGLALIGGFITFKNLNRRKTGLKQAKYLFNRFFPRGFPSGDYLYTIDEYNKTDFKH
jgi:hypothetical protein